MLTRSTLDFVLRLEENKLGRKEADGISAKACEAETEGLEYFVNKNPWRVLHYKDIVGLSSPMQFPNTIAIGLAGEVWLRSVLVSPAKAVLDAEERYGELKFEHTKPRGSS